MELPFPYELHGQSLRKLVVSLNPPSLQEQTDDWSRLKRELSHRYDLHDVRVSLPILAKLGKILRDGAWRATVVVELGTPDQPDGLPRIVDVLPGEQMESLWGVAIDIGTTSNVVWLVDLMSGRVISQAIDYNGQIARGEDVISRIIYASKGDGLSELQSLVIATLNRLLGQVADEQGISKATIYKAVVAGNSTMIHLFTGVPADSIRLMPFITAANEMPLFNAKEIGLQINPEASVDCLPGTHVPGHKPRALAPLE